MCFTQRSFDIFDVNELKGVSIVLHEVDTTNHSGSIVLLQLFDDMLPIKRNTLYVYLCVIVVFYASSAADD